MIGAILKIRRIKGDIRAASTGPRPLLKRLARRTAHRLLHRALR